MTPANRYLLYVSQSYSVAVLRPLEEAIRRDGGEVAWFFDGPGAELLRADECRLREVAEVQTFDPVAVFVPGNWVPDFFPGVKVEVFHGFSVGKRSDTEGHFRIRGLFDLYCTQGSTTTTKFRKLAERYGYFHVVETGWPKTDPLFRPGEGANPWRSGWSESRPIVLFASTFTRSITAAPHLLQPIRDLAARGKWNWLVTLHPKTAPEIADAYRALEGPHLRCAPTAEVVRVLQAADAMVSDTSSIVHEFLLQHRPAVTLRNSVPGPHLIDIHDPSQLERAVERALTRPGDLMREIAAFSDAIHPYRDGRSSERVLQATHEFIDVHRAKLRPKPMNLWRKLQLRRRLRYYNWR